MLDVAKPMVTIVPCMEGGWRWIWAVKLVGSSALDVQHEEGDMRKAEGCVVSRQM